MQSRFTVRSLAALAFVAWLTTLSTPCARADALNVTVTGPTTITVPEDGVEHDFTYTLTNNSGGTIVISPGFLHFGPKAGDLSDTGGGFSFGIIRGATCGLSVANTDSCTLVFDVGPPSGTGETDADFGSAVFTVGARFTLNGVGDSASIDSTVIQTDPGFVGTPEPSSLILLGTGILAMFGVLAKRRPV